MRKIGYFFLSFLPLLIALVVQFVASFFMIAMASVFTLAFHGTTNGKFSELFNNLLFDTEFNGCVMVIYSIIIICAYGIWYYRNLGGDFLPNVRTTFHPLQFVGIIVLIPGMQFVTSYFIALLTVVFPSWLEQYEKLLEASGLSNELTPFLFLYAILAGPIAEELIFRGVTLRNIRRVFPFWLANIFQAALFGLYHMNLLQGSYAALLGLALGYICEKGGSIYLAIFCHILYNFWGTVVTGLIGNAGINELILAGIMLVGMIVSLTLGILLFHLGQSKKTATARTLQNQESLLSS